MSYRDANDGDLSRGCRQGDAAAWRELVRRFTPLVFRVSLRMLARPEEAEDASQEAFMRIHRSIDGFDPTRPLKPWVSRITYNACLRRIEQSARQRQTQLQAAAAPGWEPTTARSPEQQAQGREASRLLEGAIGELAPRDRALITLRYREGLSDTEVAEAADMPVGTVKTRIFRARAALRRVLAPLFGEVGA